MSLKNQLVEYVSAAFTGLWVQSHEHDDALTEIAQMCRDNEWRLAVWDVERGLHLPGQTNGQAADAGGNDPLAAIRSLNAMASADSSALLVMVNAHRFMQSAEVVQALAQQISIGKTNRTFVIALSPVVQVPVELERLFVVLQHDLPAREQLHDIARGIATEDGELPDAAELDMLLDAAAGLTRYEAESAFSLSLVRHGRIVPDAVWDLKTQTLKKSGLMQLYRGTEDFSSLGGLGSLKAFTRRALLQPSRLIRQDQIETFNVQIATLKVELDETVRQLDQHFADMKSAARERLGSLYNPADYPTSLLGLFQVSWDYPALEPPEYLQQLSPDIYRQECERVSARFDKAVQLAEQAFMEELQQLVAHLTERLTGQVDGKCKVFRDSAVGNLSEFFQRFRTLNVRSNDQLDNLVSQCQQVVRGVEPQSLRDSQGLRQRVAQQLTQVENALDTLLVDKPRRNILRRPK